MVSERIWDMLCLTVDVPKVQQMTKDGHLHLTPAISTISTAERVSLTVRQSLIDHFTYFSRPSAHRLANHDSTYTSTNPVHTSSPGPDHAHYPDHANVAESAGHVLGTTIHVDLTVNASSLSRAGSNERCASIGSYILSSKSHKHSNSRHGSSRGPRTVVSG